jgi:NitT/TauT family transport system substrate-binding protein
MIRFRLLFVWLIFAFAIPAGAQEKIAVRIGYFPNITHAHALVAKALARKGKGFFEQRLGPNVELRWFAYNAGPSAMEAIFANSIDVTYVGPNPALNAYFRSQGAEIRVLAGAVNGGAALVVRPESGIAKPADFRGKKIATPQFGNTQDVEARAWLKEQGFKITQTGGDVHVVPTPNPEQIELFRRGAIDAAWTVEPWVSRLELEAKGKIFLEQKDTVTTVLVSSVRFLKQRRDLAEKLAKAHRELTDWIKANPEEAKALVREELREATKRDFPPELIERAWPRLRIEAAISRQELDKFVKDAIAAGFLRGTIDLGPLLEEVK